LSRARKNCVRRRTDRTQLLQAKDRCCHGAGIDPRGRVTFKTVLDPAVQAFLHDLKIEGTPVLPGGGY
jgi:hypothetical protein